MLKIGDKVYYRMNFGRGPDVPGVITGIGDKDGQPVTDDMDRSRWGYVDQFRKRG